VLAITVSCSGRPAAPPRLNVLLVTIDTLRADRVGVGLTPAIDRLAASGIRFTAARSAVPLTLPSHATIHTGLLPPAHGVRENGADALAETHQTLATLMKAAGYETAAFVGAFVLDHRFGLARGFDVYDDQIPRDSEATERLEAERPAAAVVDRALAWLAHRPAAALATTDQPSAFRPQPFFLWLHLYDPHAPYTPPKEFVTAGPTAYDGEVAYADSQLARLFDTLRSRGEFDSTLVVVCGDHGEGLGEHGERTHGMLVYDATLRVPLIVAGAGRAASSMDEAVSLADVAPTLLRAIGIKAPDAMKGRDLLDVVRLKPDRDLYSETEYPHAAGWSPLQALTDGRWMTIRAGAATEVYDLHTDPRQEHDLSATQTAVGAAMSARAAAIHASAAPAGARTVSPEAQERLRALGYVASSVQSAPTANAPNPAARIATWNAFEDALSAVSSRRRGAAAALQRLASANPDAPVIQTTLARALKDEGDVDAALTVYRHAAKRWPTDPVLLHDLAVTAREAAGARTGSGATALRDEALRADQAALVLEPNSAPALNGVGLLAIDEGKADQAVKAFERATALDSNNAGYWANLGNARRAVGDRAGAEQAYRRALDVDRRTVDAANGLAVLLVEAGRPGDAVPLLEQAIAAAPDFVEARLNLGIALQQSGQNARASAAYRQVLTAPARFKRERDAAAKLLAALGDGR
jgi:choline-sulfatase